MSNSSNICDLSLAHEATHPLALAQYLPFSLTCLHTSTRIHFSVNNGHSQAKVLACPVSIYPFNCKITGQDGHHSRHGKAQY